jgi:hypothetical protein
VGGLTRTIYRARQQYAERTTQITGIGTTAADVVGPITFTVTAEPWLVIGYVPWMAKKTSQESVYIAITDNAGALKSYARSAVTTLNQYVAQLQAMEFITAPGTYTRKLQAAAVAGTLDTGGGSDNRPFILAMPLFG